MDDVKKLKDPVYGYISVDSDFIVEIIDTPGFQRLRDIIQTSYAPLYSSAVHNRFVHSIGVYHLGCIASEAIRQNKEEYVKEIPDIEAYLKVFEIACLLHDIGHAPFSHTGENLYLDETADAPEKQRDLLHDEIARLTKDETLAEEITQSGSSFNNAAPHELMSVIVALRSYGSLKWLNSSEKKSFLARCITGYKYVKKLKENASLYSFLNCLISLLNSTVIDVDKLDYLIRDAFIIGFDTVRIDYKRLLKNLKIRLDVGNGSDDKSEYYLVYKRGAISVLENVVYARDAEKKWIQNHPVVLYDSYLMREVMHQLKEKYKGLFSYEALSEKGVLLDASGNKKEIRSRLLCDADVIFLMKNLTDSEQAEEYINRKNRRHPVWKSEAEYRAHLGKKALGEQAFKCFTDEMDKLFKYYGNDLDGIVHIDKTCIEKCDKDISKWESKIIEQKQGEKSIIDTARMKESLKQIQIYKKWTDIFFEFADDQGIDRDFVIIPTNQFTSGFSKSDIGRLRIEFPGLKEPCDFAEVSNVLTSYSDPDESRFFYLFYYRKNPDDKIDVCALTSRLKQMAEECCA